MKDIVGKSVIGYWRYTRGDIGIGKEKGIWKDFLGLKKGIAKNLLQLKILSSSIYFKFFILDFSKIILVNKNPF